MNDSPPTAEMPLAQTRHDEPALDAGGPLLEQAGELPARPRRRILSPLPVALLLALAVACGFIAGVLVQKGQGGSSSGAGDGFAGLRGALGFSREPGAGGASAGGATIGQVAYISHGTLYLTTAEGNTVKVTAAPGSSVTKTVQTQAKSIHPGETVAVSGTTRANGSISADAIRAGGAGGFGGALFGSSASGSGGGQNGGSSGGSGGSDVSSGGSPALFGKE